MPAPYGVVPTGFNRKQLPEIIDSLEVGTKSVFGQNLNVSPQSPNGQFNGIIGNEIANLWEMAEEVYHSADPLQASAARLDALLLRLNLPPRNGEVYSGLLLEFTGDPGVTIPANTKVTSSSTATEVYTENVSIIPSSGSALVLASPLAEGATSVAANELDTLFAAVAGVSTVTNLSSAVIGVVVALEETDSEIRQRLLGTNNGVTVTNAHTRLENTLRGLQGVVESVLYVNSTSSSDYRGIPAKTYALVIEGGDDILIGNTLWVQHTAGIGTYGSTSTGITDAQGICHKINYSRPRDAIALLDMTVRYVDGRCGCQPHDLDGLKALLIGLLNNREDCGGFGIGQPLIRSRLYAAFSEVAGLEIVSLKMAKHHYQFSMDCTQSAWDAKGFCEGEWQQEIVYTEESIAMAWDEKALFLDRAIQLTVLDKFDNTVATDCIKGVKV